MPLSDLRGSHPNRRIAPMRMKTPGGRKIPGPPGAPRSTGLEHAEHNGSDKGECDIRDYNDHSADERTRQAHWEDSLVRVAARCDGKNIHPLRAEKSVSLSLFRRVTPGNVVKDS